MKGLIDEDLVRRAQAIDLSGGNPLACRGCGSTVPLEHSPLSVKDCDEIGVLPFWCRKCGRHAQPFDRRLWSVPLPPARGGEG